jgi:hypothetical protein
MVNNVKERRMIDMGLHIDKVKAILKEVDLDATLKTAMSTSTRWEIYSMIAPYKELAELLHTTGQGLGTKTFIAEKEGLFQNFFR